MLPERTQGQGMPQGCSLTTCSGCKVGIPRCGSGAKRAFSEAAEHAMKKAHPGDMQEGRKGGRKKNLHFRVWWSTKCCNSQEFCARSGTGSYSQRSFVNKTPNAMIPKDVEESAPQRVACKSIET